MPRILKIFQIKKYNILTIEKDFQNSYFSQSSSLGKKDVKICANFEAHENCYSREKKINNTEEAFKNIPNNMSFKFKKRVQK